MSCNCYVDGNTRRKSFVINELNRFQHVAVVNVLLANTFVFISAVLTNFYLTHAARHNKYLLVKKIAAFFFLYCLFIVKILMFT